jgi:hypothetical protein
MLVLPEKKEGSMIYTLVLPGKGKKQHAHVM